MKMLMLWSVLLFSLPALAQEPAAAPAPPESGELTRAWLDLQTSGSAAGPQAQPMIGEVAGQVYQRYVDSFKYPIPATFPRDSFKGQGGSK